MLHFLTTGGKQPKDFRAILEVFVDDLLEGWINGFALYDAAKKETFICKVYFVHYCTYAFVESLMSG